MESISISKWSVGILYAFIVAAVSNSFYALQEIILLEDYWIEGSITEDVFIELLSRQADTGIIIAVIALIILIASFIIIGRWIFVSCKLNHLNGKQNLKRSPGWSIGWFAIPFANIIMPYKCLREIYLASFDKENWKDLPVSISFPIWWFGWLTGNMLQNAYFGISESLDEYSYVEQTRFKEIIQMNWIGIASDILLALSAIALLDIIKRVSNNQRKLVFSKSYIKTNYKI
tara:strand:- start:879 stop:1571 length:693 start_codon:yes stop_codon:yes gene_type:complete